MTEQSASFGDGFSLVFAFSFTAQIYQQIGQTEIYKGFSREKGDGGEEKSRSSGGSIACDTINHHKGFRGNPKRKNKKTQNNERQSTLAQEEDDCNNLMAKQLPRR